VKPTTVLLLASLVANVALVSLVYTSRSAAPGATVRAAASKSAPTDGALTTDATRATEAAGLSPDAAHQLALGRALAHYTTAMRATMSKTGTGKWWQKPDPSRLTREQREDLLQAKREMSDAMIAATGSDAFFMNNLTEGNISFLPEAKREQLRKILADYQDMMDQYGSAGGIQLASDREKMKLLRAERERDIAALLSPEELADYQMRTSPSADTVRNRYGSAIQSEEDFRKIYALQKAYDDKFPAESFTGRITPDVMKARTEAAQQLQADLRAAVGDEAYAALKRASDSDLRTVDALVARLSLAPETTDRIAAARDNYAAESQRIMADAATPFMQRRDQMQALATRAKSELASTLGAEAADAYAQRSPWVSMLQSGIGFTTTPTANSPGALSLGGGPTQSVFPVMPAGANNGTRQVVNVISSDRAPGAEGGTMFFSGGSPGQTTNTQVISVSSATLTEGHGPGDTSAAPMMKVIMAPPAETAAPATATPPKD
jgi:hypothetical protein